MKSADSAPSKMLRLDSELWSQLETKARASGRTARQEVERRLQQSLAEVSADRMSPARALSRLVELHAEDVASYCQSAEEWQAEMKLSLPTLMNSLFSDVAETSGGKDSGLAVTFARTLAERVRRAHLTVSHNKNDPWGERAARAAAQEQPSLGTLHADELPKIQKALDLTPSGKVRK